MDELRHLNVGILLLGRGLESVSIGNNPLKMQRKENTFLNECILSKKDWNQCWKFPQVRQSEADNFGGGPGTFC